MTFKTIIPIAFSLLILIPFLTKAQSTAVVLSGGGAKGFAHIGVLQALEENNIPIDYIVGNSMGALVGGLYAAGYSPDQIKKILTNSELYNFQRGNTKKDVYFFQKYQEDGSWITIPFEINKGIKARIPFNVYNIQDLDYALMEIFAGSAAAADYSFDSLFVPFRAVATDIDSSKLLIMKKGDLAKSVRASMTFPFFIKPIEVEGKLLFDGGMMDNFPVDAAVAEFKPDFIIGSKAVSNFSSPDADDIFSQMQSMLMKKADFRLDSTDGILIESISGNENVFHFEKVERYIDSGYVAACRSMVELKQRLYRRASKKELNAKRASFNNRKPELVVGEIRVKGVNEKQKHYFLKSFKGTEEKITVEAFKKQYNRLLANENVKYVYPSLAYNEDSAVYDITFDIKVAEPIFLGFGGYISSSAVNEGFLEFGFNHLGKTSKHLYVNIYFGTFYNSLFGSAKFERQGKVPFYLMIDLLLSRKNYFASSTYFFEDQAPAYIVIDENYLDVNFGIPIGLSHVLRVGASNLNYNCLYYPDNYFTRTDTADRSNFYFINPYIEFERNSLNRKQYASKGSRFFAGFNYYVGNEHTIPGSTASGAMEYRRDLSFYVASIHYEQYFNVFKPFILGVAGDFTWSNKPLLSDYVPSLLIASQYEPIPMMQSLFLQNYRAYSYGAIGAKAIFDIYKSLELRLEAYYYVPYEKILPNDGVSFSAPFSYQYLVGNVELVYYTPVGPIGLGVNYFEKDGSHLSFLFNIGYLLFNKSRFYR